MGKFLSNKAAIPSAFDKKSDIFGTELGKAGGMDAAGAGPSMGNGTIVSTKHVKAHRDTENNWVGSYEFVEKRDPKRAFLNRKVGGAGYKTELEKDKERDNEISRLVNEISRYNIDSIKNGLIRYLWELINTFQGKQKELFYFEDAKLSLLTSLEEKHQEFFKGNWETDATFSTDKMEVLFKELEESSANECVKLRDTLEDLVGLRQDLEEDLGKAKDDNKELKDKYGATDDRDHPEVSRLREENLELQKKIEDVESRAFQAGVDVTTKDSSEYWTRHQDLLKKYDEEFQKVADQRKKNATDIPSIRADVESERYQQMVIEKEKQERELEIAKLRRDIEILQRDLDRSDKRYDKYIKEIDDLNKEGAGRKKMLSQKVMDTGNEIAQLEDERQRMAEDSELLALERTKFFGKKSDELVGDNLKQMEEMAKKRRNIHSQLGSVSQSWSTKIQFVLSAIEQEEYDKVVEFMTQIGDKQKELIALLAKRDEMEKDIGTFGRCEELISFVRRAGVLMPEQITQLNEEIDRLRYNMNNNHDDINTVTLKIKDQEASIDDMKKELESLYDRIKDKQADLLKAQSALEDNSERKRIQDDIDTKLELIEQLEEKLKNKNEEIEELEKDVEQKDKEIADLEFKAGKMKQVIKEVHVELQRDNPVEDMMKDYQKKCMCPIKQISEGYYMFGTKKIYMKLMNGVLNVRMPRGKY